LVCKLHEVSLAPGVAGRAKEFTPWF
jgi:hypothetical protein